MELRAGDVVIIEQMEHIGDIVSAVLSKTDELGTTRRDAKVSKERVFS